MNKGRGISPPPVIAERQGIISLPKLCDLATHWASLAISSGDEDLAKGAQELQSWLAPFLQKKAFHSLWCKESEYQLLEPVSISFHPKMSDPEMGVELFVSETLSGVTTLTGNFTSLGAIQASEVEVRAMGPQPEPLNDPSLFGIYRMPDLAQPKSDWTAVAAHPEIWIEVHPVFRESSCQLNLRFLGLQQPLYFVFYIKAQNAQIQSEIYQAQALKRYQGVCHPILFNEDVVLRSNASSMQLIPLASGGCFWDCSFLVAFEVIETLSFNLIVNK